MGENFTLFQGTTIGAKHGKLPTIHDNVCLYEFCRLWWYNIA